MLCLNKVWDSQNLVLYNLKIVHKKSLVLMIFTLIFPLIFFQLPSQTIHTIKNLPHANNISQTNFVFNFNKAQNTLDTYHYCQWWLIYFHLTFHVPIIFNTNIHTYYTCVLLYSKYIEHKKYATQTLLSMWYIQTEVKLLWYEHVLGSTYTSDGIINKYFFK